MATTQKERNINVESQGDNGKKDRGHSDQQYAGERA
ncbi:hypothetical protein X758_14395 [Mesorhizobium sp. LSHC416B00]|nr:hypothetical protein X761_17020 [Mesorhizobium sp. LSHC424B00]ESX72358.1 hypothetical protein X758_14395 [Mesorhizobium sp. LSHC416B00]